MTTYELIPCGNLRQATFYQKARVERMDDGTEVLYSYNTPVLKRTPSGDFKRVRSTWSDSIGWSATTGRHVYSFCYQYGVIVGKKEWDKMEYEEGGK